MFLSPKKSFFSNVAIAMFLLTNCRAAAPNSATLDAAVTPGSTPYESALDELKNLGTTFYKSDDNFKKIYSACWENPAGKDLSEIEKVVYCYLPIEFRLCNSVGLKNLGKRAAQTKKITLYDECADSSGLADILGKPDLRLTYINLFLAKGLKENNKIIDDLITTYKPTSLFTAPFLLQFRDVVQHYIEFNGGGDWTDAAVMASAKVKLKKSMEPAFDSNSSIDGAQIFVDTFELVIKGYQMGESTVQAVENGAQPIKDQLENLLGAI